VVALSKTSVSILTPIEEKLEHLQSIGIDAAIVLPFTETLARISPEDFIETLVHAFPVCGFVSGTSHVFGTGRSGNTELLETLGRRFIFTVDIVPPVLMNGKSVSSTRIRNLLLDGNVENASRFLGRYYTVSGSVVKGAQIGGKMGFSTANLQPEGSGKLIPKDGVYSVFVRLDGDTVLGTTNIGFCPTVEKTEKSIEVHIHQYNGDLYGRRIMIDFVRRLRDEKKFDSVEALIEQMKQDKHMTEQLLSNIV
jgi:riboflavin kinase/FMN adenylyltransferase